MSQPPPEDPPAGGAGWVAPGTSYGPGAGVPPPPPRPPQPPQPLPGGPPAYAPGSDPRWAPGGWQPPPIKPGIVALRPLGVGEVLDGAIAAVRNNPRTMLGLSAVVVVAVTVLQFGALYLLTRELSTAATAPGSDITAIEPTAELGGAVVLLLLSLAVQTLGTAVLTGVLAVAVGAAVIGRRPGPAEAWAAVRPVVGRVIALPLVIGLLLLAPFVVVALAIWLMVVAGLPGAVIGLFGTVAVIGLTVVAVWLLVRWAVAATVLVLESGGGTRRVGIGDALSRSAALVQGAWWRTFGILLLVTVIASVVSGIAGFPLQVASNFVPGGPESIAGLALASLAGLVGGLLVTPFQAAATALVYVDRRIRREGLDIELARAAGVELPGRGPTGGVPSW